MSGQVPAQQLSTLKTVLAEHGARTMLEAGVSALNAKLAGSKSTGDLPPQESKAAATTAAIIEAVVLASASNGELSGDDAARLATVIGEITAGGIDTRGVATMVAKYAELLGRDGLAVRASYLQRSLEDDAARRVAFVTAAAVAALDPSRDADDETFELLADALDLPADEAEQILVETRKRVRASK